MSHPDPTPELAIWTDTLRAALVADILKLMGDRLAVTAMGFGQAPVLASMCHPPAARMFDDFRCMINERPAGFMLLATMEGVRLDDLFAALSAGAVILSLEPIHHSVDGFGGTSRSAGSSRADGAAGVEFGRGHLIPAPAFRDAPGLTAMPAPRDVIGEPRLIHIEQLGGEAEASLWARLCDAWATALGLVGIPEAIDASLVGPLTSIPSDPRGLTGSLVAHGRGADGAALTLAVSDRCPMHARSVRLLAQSGRAVIDDHAFEMFDATGKLLDRGAAPLPPASPSIPARLVADMWLRMLDHPALLASWPRGPEPAHVLACALASHLSARTRQPESPAQILQMHL